MDVTIFYFSQSGNTHKVAKSISAGFIEMGSSVQMTPIKEANPQDADGCDMIGVGSPCFSSRAPTPVIDFISTLPFLHRVDAFVFATCGGAPGRVLFDLASGLSEKGAVLSGGFLARGEVHHPAPRVNGFSRGRPNAEDIARAKQFAKSLSEGSLMDLSMASYSNISDTLGIRGKFYDFLGRSSTDEVMRLMMPQPMVDYSKCTQCDWCVSECPMGNIRLDPNPVIDKRCIRCYRCLTGCPENVFHANWRFADPFLWFFYNPRFVRWFGGLRTVEM